MPNAFTVNEINKHGSQQGKAQVEYKSPQDPQNVEKVDMGMPEMICHKEN